MHLAWREALLATAVGGLLWSPKDAVVATTVSASYNQIRKDFFYHEVAF